MAIILGSHDGLSVEAPITNQSNADLSCPSFNYIQGMYLNINQVLNAGGKPVSGGGDPTKNTINSNSFPPKETSIIPSPNVNLS